MSNAATNPAGTPLGGQSVGVDVQNIEKELAALWRAQGGTGSDDGESSKALTRACSWNLIVQCADDAAMQLGKDTANTLVRSVPTRTILVKSQPWASGREIEAFVSANCLIAPGGGKLLCTEEIQIEAKNRGVELVPGLLRSLCVSDVPTAMWWAGAPPSDASAVRVLLSGVDRLVVDSAHATSGGLGKLAHIGGLLDGITLTDLNWLRTASLRTMLASLFDPPSGHEPLWRTRTCRLEVTERGMPAAKLLVGWLVSRLKWTVAERMARPTGASWRVLSRDEAPMAVDIDIVPSTSRSSGVHSLQLETGAGERYGVRDVGDGQLELVAPSLGRRTVTAQEPPLEQLLVAALGARGRDKLFGVALHRCVELDR